LAGAAPPVDTSFGAKHAASRGAAAKAASLSTASLRSERGSKNGRDSAVVEMQIAAVAIISVTCFIPVLPHAVINHSLFSSVASWSSRNLPKWREVLDFPRVLARQAGGEDDCRRHVQPQQKI
jgi:hypothetical protein